MYQTILSMAIYPWQVSPGKQKPFQLLQHKKFNGVKWLHRWGLSWDAKCDMVRQSTDQKQNEATTTRSKGAQAPVSPLNTSSVGLLGRSRSCWGGIAAARDNTSGRQGGGTPWLFFSFHQPIFCQGCPLEKPANIGSWAMKPMDVSFPVEEKVRPESYWEEAEDEH